MVVEVRNNAELVTYTSAAQLADAFERSSRRLEELRLQMIAEVDSLNATFSSLDINAQFSCEVGICGAADPRQIAREMKRVAWRSLMDRLGVRQLMSMARKEEFDEAMRTPGVNSWRGWIDHRDVDKIDKLPDISRESILGVISGTAANAGEYLRENVVEVYKKLKPWRSDTLKTNQKNRWQLSDKVILGYTCSRSGRGVWNLTYGDHGRLVENLENVFRLLDGKGFRNTHLSEIEEKMHESGTGQTEYFAFKCYGNQNLHLKFLRPDLVTLFNQLAGNSRQLRGRDSDAFGGSQPDYSRDDPFEGGLDLFETPVSLAEEMCRIAGIQTGSKVLEPSCGPGRIVQAAIERGACVTAIDLDDDSLPYSLRQNPAVIATTGQNFLELTPESVGGYFNAVLMNPPFSRSRDAKHVRHAWQFVAKGGCLVAVASAGVLFRTDRIYREFRQWLLSVKGEIIELPERTFRESGTDVNSVLVVVRDLSDELVLEEE